MINVKAGHLVAKGSQRSTVLDDADHSFSSFKRDSLLNYVELSSIPEHCKRFVQFEVFNYSRLMSHKLIDHGPKASKMVNNPKGSEDSSGRCLR